MSTDFGRWKANGGICTAEKPGNECPPEGAGSRKWTDFAAPLGQELEVVAALEGWGEGHR